MKARQLSRAIRDLERVPSQAATDTARDLSREIQGNFDRGVDPFERPWRKLARSTIEGGRHNPPLTDTGRGRRSVRVFATAGAGIRITVGTLYMLFHQFGGASHLKGGHKNKKFGTSSDLSAGRSNPPKRSFLPFDVMPPRWLEIMQRNIDKRVAALKVARR